MNRPSEPTGDPVLEQLASLGVDHEVMACDPALADTDDIYDLPQYHQGGWGVAYGDALDVEANYLLLCDNLCDPTHVNYVHPSTLSLIHI